MSLENKINSDLKSAMLSKNEAALRALRAVKSAILLAKTSGGGHDVSEADEMKILQKLVKQRKDSVAIYDEQGRGDLAQTEREEIDIIEKYLPAQMSEDEIKFEVEKIVGLVQATGLGDTGKVMGAASKALAVKANLDESCATEILSAK